MAHTIARYRSIAMMARLQIETQMETGNIYTVNLHRIVPITPDIHRFSHKMTGTVRAEAVVTFKRSATAVFTKSQLKGLRRMLTRVRTMWMTSEFPRNENRKMIAYALVVTIFVTSSMSVISKSSSSKTVGSEELFIIVTVISEA
ncbi:hypothetical protein pdam_00006670 [Pocillopora damicornis]|uniref:Uncharacterized protein n=1 Tax=Pocillopora damicornis TaxID=46731 RepID=A0A3M6TKQ7_POCDA|nr:hypothetical protein pdam_00006670 [Pocillopora damicornis]